MRCALVPYESIVIIILITTLLKIIWEQNASPQIAAASTNCRRARVIQLYLPGGASVHPKLKHGSLGLTNLLFLPRDALLSAVYAVVVCLCVCVCVCHTPVLYQNG